VLQSHARPLVPLAEELKALERQRVLASARYQDQVRVSLDVPADAANRWALPPAILGELLLNAVKHSRIDPTHPLVVHVSLDGDALRVANPVSLVTTSPVSTRTGLANLAERVRLCTGRVASWGIEQGHFVVRIPLEAL
jgi:LytS/YehU family sensor histidine kinase